MIDDTSCERLRSTNVVPVDGRRSRRGALRSGRLRGFFLADTSCERRRSTNVVPAEGRRLRPGRPMRTASGMTECRQAWGCVLASEAPRHIKERGAAGRGAPRSFCKESGASAAPRRIYGLPAAFQGDSPAPGLSPGGCGEPQIVVRRVSARVPDFCSPPSMQDASRSTPQAGRDGLSVRAVWPAGISLAARSICASAGKPCMMPPTG